MPFQDVLSLLLFIIFVPIMIGLTVLGSEEMALPSAVYALMMSIPVAGVVAVGRRWFPEQSQVTHAA